MAEDRWPPLPYSSWRDTCATLHMWSQIVGKIALAQGPPLNHSWGTALQLTPAGLSTRSLTHGTRTFTMAFDFLRHQLVIEVDDGTQRTLPLVPQTVADFYAETMAVLRELDLPVKIWTMPVEIPAPIRFETDTVHAAYDAAAVTRFWRAITASARVLTTCSCRFIGKSSPVHFFWGSFDLAVTRFSGKPAPPRAGPAFMREAYSHEVISHGFWPGNDAFPEAAFYAYAVPSPDGLAAASIEPAAAYYHRDLGEFILPYEAVRLAADPEAALGAFVESTYAKAAALAGWDVAGLSRGAVGGDPPQTAHTASEPG